MPVVTMIQALEFLEQSLAIRKEIGDKSGMGTTLNNISSIFQRRGDYDKALEFLEQSLAIRKEIGDKSGMIPTLHNMAMISLNKKDIQKFMETEGLAYRIAHEVNDAVGVFSYGKYAGTSVVPTGAKRRSPAHILQQSLTIAQQSGLPGWEPIAAILQKEGAAYKPLLSTAYPMAEQQAPIPARQQPTLLSPAVGGSMRVS